MPPPRYLHSSGMDYICQTACLKLEVAAHGEEAGDDADEHADEHLAADDEERVVAEEVDGALDVDVTVEFGAAAKDGGIHERGGDDSGDDAVEGGFEEEGTANEPLGGPDEFHDLDLVSAGEDGHADGIEDDEGGDDEK